MRKAFNAVDDDKVVEGSGNIFADLKLPNAAEELAKAQLKLATVSILKECGHMGHQA